MAARLVGSLVAMARPYPRDGPRDVVRRSVLGGQCPQMSAARASGRGHRVERDLDRAGLGRLAHGVGEGEEVVGGGAGVVLARQPEDLPPAGSGESLAVGIAQVVGV